MPPPPVTIYVTSLTSQPKVRKHIELLHRALRGLEIPYESFDLVIDEDAKRRWQRSKPPGVVVGLPGYLVGGEWVGTMDDFEYAVETGTLETFLKQDVDLGVSSDPNDPSGSGNTSQSIGEAELERLMRDMTDDDLDKLVGELSVDDIDPTDIASASKVGLFVAPLETPSTDPNLGTTLKTAQEPAPPTEPTPLAHAAPATHEPSPDAEAEPETSSSASENVDADTLTPTPGPAAELPAEGDKTLDDVIDQTLVAEAKEKID